MRVRKHVLWVALAALAAAVPLLVLGAAAASPPTLSTVAKDQFTDPTALHAAVQSGNMVANGKTIVTTYAAGPIFDGGSDAIGWATSVNGGGAWSHGSVPVTYQSSTLANAAQSAGPTSPAPYPLTRADHPVVAYDVKHATWLISSIGLSGNAVTQGIFVNKSSDGTTWSQPVIAHQAGTGDTPTSQWIRCDNGAGSAGYGNCYLVYSNSASSPANRLEISTSTDGGTTWSAPVASSDLAVGTGAVPLVQPPSTSAVVPPVPAFPPAPTPSKFCHVVDGSFTTCADGKQEWKDVVPQSFPNTNTFTYSDQADQNSKALPDGSPNDTAEWLYDKCGQTTPLGQDEYALISFNSVEVENGHSNLVHYAVHVFSDHTITVLENGKAVSDGHGSFRAAAIEGQHGNAGFGPSPNCAGNHVIVEYEIPLQDAVAPGPHFFEPGQGTCCVSGTGNGWDSPQGTGGVLVTPGPGGAGCTLPNPLPGDCDGDGIPNVYPPGSFDADGNNISGAYDDNCWLTPNGPAQPPSQQDSNADGIGDACTQSLQSHVFGSFNVLLRANGKTSVYATNDLLTAQPTAAQQIITVVGTELNLKQITTSRAQTLINDLVTSQVPIGVIAAADAPTVERQISDALGLTVPQTTCGRVVVPYTLSASSIGQLVSTDCGATFAAHTTITSTLAAQHTVSVGLKTSLLPSDSMDSSGAIYLAWQTRSLRVASTTLSAAAAVGATNIKVASVTGLAAGQTLTIDPANAAKETVTITTVGTSGATGTGVTLTAPLTNAHASGAVVNENGVLSTSTAAPNDIAMAVMPGPTAAAPNPVFGAPTRIPIEADSGQSSNLNDHFIPAILVRPGTSGGTAQIGLFYYHNGLSTCLLEDPFNSDHCMFNFGFVSSVDGGASWSAPQYFGNMSPAWLPRLSGGPSFGNYLGAAIPATGPLAGHAFAAFANATGNAGPPYTVPSSMKQELDVPDNGLPLTGP